MSGEVIALSAIFQNGHYHAAQKGTLLRGKIDPRKPLKPKGLDRAKGYAHNSGVIGYARVSREDQNPQYQLDALQAAGCLQVFEDRISGAEFVRAGLDQALAALEPGSVLVVWKLDRLGRSMLDTVKIVLDLDRRGIGFRSLTESFDTKTALGRGVLALLAAVAEDERDRLRERTRAGMQAAQRAGKHVGRPSTLTPEKLDLARRLIEEGKGRHRPDDRRPSCHAAAGAEGLDTGPVRNAGFRKDGAHRPDRARVTLAVQFWRNGRLSA
jgi:DNA invertase Pin-like site-specific DNA recombinase